MRRLRFGLAANRLHIDTPDALLFALLRRSAAGIVELEMELHAVGRTYDAIRHAGLLRDYPGLIGYPYGRDGGLMKLVSHIAGGLEPGAELDGAIYLMDPVDPSSAFPEAHALKRQCVTHRKPFLSTIASAAEWIEVERLSAGLAPDPAMDEQFNPRRRTVALIAHDALKDEMVAFASRHFDLLSAFERRVATGTTGGRLNELAWSRGWPRSHAWTDRFLSGPLGGDAQIAELIIDRRCQRAIFFEDPHVARQHEADIQLLERAVMVAGEETVCATSPAMAEKWASAVAARGNALALG